MGKLSRRLRRIAASIVKRVYLAIGSGCSVGESYGIRFLFDWRHSIDKKVAFRLYENEQLVFFIETIHRFKPDYFFDIGAHAGLYALLAWRNSASTEVHAFEPDKQNLSQLYANLYLNKCYDLINIHNIALSNKAGSAFLERTDSTSRATRHLSPSGNYPVSIERLDDLFAEVGKTAFFKIDVEGHELSVIEGAKNFLENNKCIVLVESVPEKVASVQGIMESLAYRKVYIPIERFDHVFANFEFSFEVPCKD